MIVNVTIIGYSIILSMVNVVLCLGEKTLSLLKDRMKFGSFT